MKKQVKKLSKKILVLGLATSIIFTSCFSYKKINVHATSVALGLGAYTLYEICLYIGGLAITTLGIGYAYENRDEIAEFGKSVIDTMSDLPALGWIMGSHTMGGDYVYGTEALKEVQDTEWTVIQGGGNSPKNDNDDDGDEDEDDIIHELNLNGYFLTSAGVSLFQNHIKPIYDKWVNNEVGDIVNPHLGIIYYNDIVHEDLFYSAYKSWDKTAVRNRLIEMSDSNIDFNGYHRTADGYYLSYRGYGYPGANYSSYDLYVTSSPPAYVCIKDSSASVYRHGIYCFDMVQNCKEGSLNLWTDNINYFETNAGGGVFYGYGPLISTQEQLDNLINYGLIPSAPAEKESFRVADWIADDEHWKGYLEDIATSLRSLQDLTAIAQQLADNTLTTQPSADAYGDMMDNLGTEYAPKTDPIVNPTYYPATNTTPQLDPSVFPNYVPPTVPDSGGSDSPSGDGTEEVPEIDLDGLLSIFNILFYLIMIIVMLIYLFLSCLAFIVMIFRIPASSSMLPEDMVLGYEHLKTIMIPGMNISIYGFAMALIYLFIIFAVIKLIRLEINDFKFPRSYK